jgi:hypothetical protein
VIRYAIALGLTLAIEVPVYAAVLSRLGHVRIGRGAQVGVLVNLVSHPLAFLVARPLLRRVMDDTAALAVVEVAVMLGEAWGVWRITRGAPAALVGAALANTASLALGLALL